MLKLIFITFLSFVALFFGREKLKEENLITMQPSTKALLITHNGCWDINHFIINRGDSVLNIPATIGHDVYGYTLHDSIVWEDTLPTNYLLDFTIPDGQWQSAWTNAGIRYFFAASSNYIYLFSANTTMAFTVNIDRIDSLITPPGFTKMAMDDYSGSLLVACREPDSVSYSYSFYSVPTLSLDTQLIVKLRPDVITMKPYSFPPTYNIGGDSMGVARIIELIINNYQVVRDIILPSQAKNIKQLSGNNYFTYFLSTPGDSVSNFVKLNLSDTSFIVNTLFQNTGILSSTYAEMLLGGFLFQPYADTSSYQFDKQLLFVDFQQGAITDTFWLNKRINSLHYNNSPSYGGSPYKLIMSMISGLSSDWVYYSWDYQLSSFDSFPAGAAPIWFAEDVGCQIGIEETEKKLSMDIFPNPAADNIHIHISGLAKGKTYDFTITDVSGKLLWKKDILAKEKYEIPIQNFPAGVLILKIDAGNKSISKKLVKL